MVTSCCGERVLTHTCMKTSCCCGRVHLHDHMIITSCSVSGIHSKAHRHTCKLALAYTNMEVLGQ